MFRTTKTLSGSFSLDRQAPITRGVREGGRGEGEGSEERGRDEGGREERKDKKIEMGGSRKGVWVKGSTPG